MISWQCKTLFRRSKSAESRRSIASALSILPSLPPQRGPLPAPACQDSGPSIPLACPPLAPELQSRRKVISDAVKKLKDLAKLQAVARALAVSTPVPTVRCIQRDIVNHIEQICTDEKLQEMTRALPDPGLMTQSFNGAPHKLYPSPQATPSPP